MVRLDPDRALDQLGDHVLQTAAKERSPVECAKFGRMLFKDVQDFGVLDESRFGDLAQPFDEDVVGQRDECLEVGEHAGRRVERADEVLALRRVDAGLAARRGVHHGEQRRGAIDVPHAAHPCGGHETGQIRGGASADAHHGVGACEASSPSRCQMPLATSIVLPASASGITMSDTW